MKTRETTKNNIINRLKQGGTVLISSHVSPDGDSVGSALAMQALAVMLGCKAFIVCHDKVVPKYSFLNRHDLIEIYEKDKEYPHYEILIAIEAPEPARLGDVKNLLSNGCEVINIDHHPGNTMYGNINFVDESAAAAAMLIYELFELAEIEINKDIAEELFTAILTDTGRFRFANTSPNVLRVCAELLEAGVETKKINDALYANYQEDQLRLLGEIIANMEIYHHGNTCFLLCDSKLMNKYSEGTADMEGLVEYSLYTSGMQVGVLLREISKDNTKVSLRSQSYYDVSTIARFYGGGGHPNASGCYIAKNITAVKEELLLHISKGYSK